MDKKWFNKIVLIIILLISITTFSYLVMDNNLWNKITFLVVDENVEPLSYYSFEDNFQDSTGDVECTNYGASFVEGKEGKAVSFDGVGDFLTCPGKDVKDFTISLWVKLEEKIWHTLIERGVDGRYGIWYSGSTNQIFLVSGSDPGGWAVSETNDLEDGEWHYIAGIYESGVGASFYVDGIKLDTLKDITSDPIVSGSLVVGGSSRYGGNLVKGELDEIKIRDIVLTPEDIKEEYNSYINQGVECVADTDCSSLDLECKVGKCINDECVQENKVNGTLCDDNLLCSENDVCSLGSCSGTEISNCQKNEGLITNYNFENNFEDSTGNNDATNYGTSFVDGKVGKGVSFDGVDDYISLGQDVFTLAEINEGSFETWIKLSNKHSSIKHIFSIEDSIILWLDQFNRPTFSIWDSGRNEYKQIISRLPINSEEWEHLMVTWDFETGFFNLYLNGELISSSYVLSPPNIDGYNREITIGSSNYWKSQGKPYYFYGTLDEIKIWSRKINDIEIKERYYNPPVEFDKEDKIFPPEASKAYSYFQVYAPQRSLTTDFLNQPSYFTPIYNSDNKVHSTDEVSHSSCVFYDMEGIYSNSFVINYKKIGAIAGFDTCLDCNVFPGFEIFVSPDWQEWNHVTSLSDSEDFSNAKIIPGQDYRYIAACRGSGDSNQGNIAIRYLYLEGDESKDIFKHYYDYYLENQIDYYISQGKNCDWTTGNCGGGKHNHYQLAVICLSLTNAYKIEEKEDYIIKAEEIGDYLIEKKDLNNNGLTGWGLYFAYDSFLDGNTNPSNTEYFVHTPKVMKCLSELYEITEKQEYLDVAIEAAEDSWDFVRTPVENCKAYPYSYSSYDQGRYLRNTGLEMASALAFLYSASGIEKYKQRAIEALNCELIEIEYDNEGYYSVFDPYYKAGSNYWSTDNHLPTHSYNIFTINKKLGMDINKELIEYEMNTWYYCDNQYCEDRPCTSANEADDASNKWSGNIDSCTDSYTSFACFIDDVSLNEKDNCLQEINQIGNLEKLGWGRAYPILLNFEKKFETEPLICIVDSDCSSLDLECKVGKCVDEECVQENKVDGIVCDDGNVCSENDVCSLGVCSGVSRDCDDGNVCTDDVCDESLGCVNNFNTVSCNDNLFCTQGDVCSLGSCSGVSRDCDDNIECTLDSCDEGLGECVNVQSVFVDDDCDNYDDDCDGLVDEDYIETVTSCGVGECDNSGLLGCISGVEVDDCDSFFGAVDETCDDETGFDSLDNNCDGVLDLDCDSYCDKDGDGYSERGICVFALYKIGDCDDSNSAINPGAEEICDNIDNNCDDDIDDISRGCSNVCFSGEEVCSVGEWGSCDALRVPGNYNNLCNVGVGECKSSGFIDCQGDCSAVALDPREEVCNDLDDDCDGEVDEEDACYVPECVADTDCSSLDLECKVGKCINDECVQENKVDGLSCDDGNICSENDVCSLGSCVGSSRDCDDGNVCTDDVCDESLGCVNNFNTVSCNDNLFCTQGDVCILGSCSGISRSCDDNIECTLDSCDEGLGECVNWLRNSFCNNGLFCDGNEVCDIFQGCLSLNNIGCDDKNKKTYDSCNEDTDSCVNELIVLDDDKDGVPNNKDKCPNSIISALEGVNNKGCVKPKLDKFDIKKNLDNQDLNSVENFEIGIKKFGKIKFNEKVKLIRQNSKINLEDNINISGNRIEINSSALPELNKSAIITLYNINYSSPKIIVDARLCAECNITFWSKELSILEFSVPHFTIYEIFEGYCGDGIIDFDEECDLSNITSTCQDFDYTSGEVACFNNCSLNISGCYDEDTSGGSSVGGGGSKKKSNVKNNLTDLNNITYLNEEGIDNLNESLNSEMIPEEIVKDKSSMKVMIISGVFILVIIIALVVFIYFKLKNKEVLMEKVKINQNRSSP